MRPLQNGPQDYLGTWRRFGAAGPVYEIIGIAGETREGDRLMRIRVLETGEETEMRLQDLLDDPTEH